MYNHMPLMYQKNMFMLNKVDFIYSGISTDSYKMFTFATTVQ